MEQLHMIWKRRPAAVYAMPEGFAIRNFREGDTDAWLGLCVAGQLIDKVGPEEFKKTITDFGPMGLEPGRDVFVVEHCDGRMAATITAFVYTAGPRAGEGLIHMVAADPAVRGRGLGNAMMTVAMGKLYGEGCETARLKTDDFRLPAIMSYINQGFMPYITQEDMNERWLCVLEKLGAKIRK